MVVSVCECVCVCVVSHARPTSAKWEGIGELRIVALSSHTVWCGPITLQ